MSQVNPTIIAGTLDDSELLKSIKEIVNAVDSGMDEVSAKFDTKLTEIEEKFKDAGTKIGTAFKYSFNSALGGSFDQLAAAMEKISNSSGKFLNNFGGCNGGAKDLLSQIEEVEEQINDLKIKGITNEEDKARLDAMIEKLQKLQKEKERLEQGPETVADLDKIIAMEEHRRKKMELESSELLEQNKYLQQAKDYRKEQLATEEQLAKAAEKEAEAIERAESKKLKKEQAPYVKELNRAITMPAKDIDQAQAKLDRLQETKERMVQTGLFDEAQLNRAQNAIDNLQKKIQQIQSKTPKTLKEVMGMDESSVDAITTKMAALKRVQLDPRNKDEVNKLSQAYQDLQKKQNNILGKNAQMEQANLSLARSFGYIRNRIAYALTIGALTSFVRQIYEVRGQYELLERSLGVLVGSFQRGSQIFRELNEMAVRSPFTLIELGTAAKQLTAYNFSADEVVNTTKRLADISAALGVPMERLTYNLGQIRAQTVLTARDARDFANAGLPIVKSLAEYYSELEGHVVSTGDVYDRMSKKMVSYNDVMSVLNKMTDEGGKFFDFQAKQAETLRVQINNLTLAWNNMLNELGSANQSLLALPVKAMRSLLQNWKSLDNLIWDVISLIGVFKTTQVIYYNYAQSVGRVSLQMKGVYQGGQKMVDIFKKVGTSIKDAFMNKANWVTLFATALLDLGWSAWESYKATKALNEEIRNTARESLSSLEKFSQTYQNVRNSLNKPQADGSIKVDVDIEQANKAWEAMKEEIQSSSSASDTFISKLESIENISDRLRKGFEYIDKMREVDGMLETIGQRVISVRQDWRKWWNLWLAPEGLKKNIEDYIQALKEGATSTYGAYTTMYGDLKATVKKMFNEFQLLDPDQQRMAFERTLKAIAQQEKMGVEEYRIMRMNAEMIYSVFATGAAKEEFAMRRAEQETFFRWLNERHSSELQARLGNMSKQEIEQGKWLVGENGKWVEEMTKQFTAQYGLSFDGLYNYVKKANTWSIYIPVMFGKQEEEKSIYDQLTEADAKLDAANKRRERLQERIKQLDSQGKQGTKEYEKAQKELTEAQNDYNDALAEGARLKKKGGGGAKKDPLGDALTKEVQVIGDITKRYKEYQQIGVSAQDAIRLATDEYGNTLARLNAQLGKYGIATKTSEELASMDIRGIRDYYNTLLEGAKNTNNAKGIEALEKAIAGINVEITKLDYKKITDGLNNELSKLKDEYELAVELDANPEMSNLFMELFDIDPNALPQSIDDYAQRVLDKLNKSFESRKIDFRLPTLNLTDDNINAYKEQLDAGIIDKATFDAVETAYKGLRAMREKNAKETLKSTQELQYKLADVNGKIAIEQKKLADLEVKYQKEANAEKKRLLELQIQDQRNTIAELQSQALALMPEYERVFGSIIEHSAHTSRRLQKDLLDVYNKATRNANGDYVLTGSDGSTTILTEERYTRERNKLTKEMQKSMSDFKKIKEAFKPSDEDDVVDYAKGIELVGSEIQKLGALMGTIGNIAEGLGFSEESVEILNDVSATLDGLGQATQGYAKIMNGDVIGGLTDMVTGLWNSISAWTDNSDKRITREVEKSERSVRRLELAYKDLEYEVNKAYGTAAVSARQLAIENKKLQLAELERQLALEESRSGKKRDEDRIIDIKGQIKDLRNEINDSVEEITNTLLGISSVGDAVENMVGVVIEALRNGESGIDAFNNSIDDMIFNLMKKWASTKYLAPIVERAMDEINAIVNNETGANELARLQAEQLQIQEALSQAKKVPAIVSTKNIIAQLKERYAQNERAIEEAMGSFGMDETKVASIKEILEGLKQEGKGLTDFLTLLFDNFGVDVSGTTANLSALQQGLQSMSEDTASALEAYMNGVSQQVYLHSTLLTEIRDAVVGFDLDVQSGTIGEILLQLQQSYQVQMSIESMLNGWNNASGRAIRVEMVS